MKIHVLTQSRSTAWLLTGLLAYAPPGATALIQPAPPASEFDLNAGATPEIDQPLWLARQELGRGQFKQAKALCEQVLELAHDNLAALALLAAAEKGLGNQAVATKLAAKVRQLAPGSPALPLAMAQVERFGKAYAEAEKIYRDGMELSLGRRRYRV